MIYIFIYIYIYLFIYILLQDTIGRKIMNCISLTWLVQVEVLVNVAHTLFPPVVCLKLYSS